MRRHGVDGGPERRPRKKARNSDLKELVVEYYLQRLIHQEWNRFDPTDEVWLKLTMLRPLVPRPMALVRVAFHRRVLPMLVMEYIEGGDLHHSIQAHDVPAVLDCIVQVCLLLKAVEARSIRFNHRDLHGGNVLWKRLDQPRTIALPDGRVYETSRLVVLADLGMACGASSHGDVLQMQDVYSYTDPTFRTCTSKTLDLQLLMMYVFDACDGWYGRTAAKGTLSNLWYEYFKNLIYARDPLPPYNVALTESDRRVINGMVLEFVRDPTRTYWTHQFYGLDLGIDAERSPFDVERILAYAVAHLPSGSMPSSP